MWSSAVISFRLFSLQFNMQVPPLSEKERLRERKDRGETAREKEGERQKTEKITE